MKTNINIGDSVNVRHEVKVLDLEAFGINGWVQLFVVIPTQTTIFVF